MTKRSFTPADAVLVAIDMAKNRQEVLIERPDRGSQYVWIRYSDTANAWPKQASSPRSAASANSYDNALAETINGLYKAEVIHRRGPWRSFEAVEYATLESGAWFNQHRLLEPIGNIPPAEAEERYYAMIEQRPLAA